MSVDSISDNPFVPDQKLSEQGTLLVKMKEYKGALWFFSRAIVRILIYRYLVVRKILINGYRSCCIFRQTTKHIVVIIFIM